MTIDLTVIWCPYDWNRFLKVQSHGYSWTLLTFKQQISSITTTALPISWYPLITCFIMHYFIAEHASEAFDDFLQCIGEKVRLKDFDKYRAQLDNKSK